LYITSGNFSISGRTNSVCINTLSDFQVTSIVSARVVVITIESRKVAVSFEASSNSALIWSFASWLGDATNSSDVSADITRGRNTRWADQFNNNTVASGIVTLEGFSNWRDGAAGLWRSDTTTLRITEADAAKISRSWADNIGRNDSFERIADSVDALILEIVGDVDWCVDTFSGVDVAGVGCTQVVVVTANQSVDTISSILVARVHCARIVVIA